MRALAVARLAAALVAFALTGALPLVADAAPAPAHRCGCRVVAGERHECGCGACRRAVRAERAERDAPRPPCHGGARGEPSDEPREDEGARVSSRCGGERPAATPARPFGDAVLADAPAPVAHEPRRLHAHAARRAGTGARAPEPPPPRCSFA